VSEDKRENFLNIYSGASKLSNKKWAKGYGELNLGKVRLQTQALVLEKAEKFINEFSSIEGNG